ncbi:MAG: choice-of-anchor B family protein, partial [Gemmatimonadetes bacterium]|nr:choice-of-anchor B family protein [Gemmatimonadota bacterium]
MSPSRVLRALLLSLLLSAPLAPGPGFAQSSQDIIFHSNLDEHGGYSDVWGYTAPNGDEYAILGAWNGTAVINVSDPIAPYETAFFPGAFSTWRDIKTYGHHAYICNESSGGIVILDLSDPENPVERAPYLGISTAHNLFIDESTARCYIAGSNLGFGGLRILSLASPENPVEVGSWENSYIHDVVVNDNRAYCAAIFSGQLVMLDVANPAAIPLSIGIVQNYVSAFTHNAWMTDDNQFVMTTDEVAGSSIRMWDVSNPVAPVQTDSYRPNPAGAPHNAHLDGGLAYISHYTAGVRVVDISDPYTLTEVGFYDTYPSGNGSTFDGCWGVFP